MIKDEKYYIVMRAIEEIAFMDVAPDTGGNTHLIHYYKDKALLMQKIAVEALDNIRDGH